jgi:hypothetical protein
MTPLEKARELVEKYYWIFGDGYLGQQHIQCALIAVDEILNAIYNEDFDGHLIDEYDAASYFQLVKQEIEKL